MSTHDPNQILLAYLATSGTALYTLVGARIYIPRRPPGVVNTSAFLEITSSGTGEGFDKFVPGECVSDYQIKCFGGTTNHAVARQVYGALVELLHSAFLTGAATSPQKSTAYGVLSYAEQQSDGQDIFDPDTGVPYVLTQFRVRTRAS